MDAGWGQVWMLVIAAAALSGWWLCVRPRATYGGTSETMSALIVLMAVLLCVLAVNGQWGMPRAAKAQPASATVSASSEAPAAPPTAPPES